MTEIAIRAEGLGKQYRLGRAQPKYDTLRDSLSRTARSALARLRSGLRPTSTAGGGESFWALRDVSFELHRGEVLGIVGRNGAGKSTLLKVLTRITKPTTGWAEVRGRVGSLLEVGTGFHPELTGRENIFLNGSILGMTRTEIYRQFDRIVDFAEVGQFVDTPVKHYSSGMYMRLAFAVAAHLEPEVLVVDEVLAVGDAEFQKKCLGRMSEVSREGRTVLFVSHNMHAIQRLCTRCLLLEKGRAVAMGPTAPIVTRYLSSGAGESVANDWIPLGEIRRTGSGAARYVAVKLSSLDEAHGFQPFQEGPLVISLAIESRIRPSVVGMAISVYDQQGTHLINADSDTLGEEVLLPEGWSVWQFSIKKLYLKPGIYVLGLWLADRMGDVYDRVEAALQFEVVELVEPRVGVRLNPRYDGVVTCRFELEQATSDLLPSRVPLPDRAAEGSPGRARSGEWVPNPR
jgi:lipopolysaccharide transport system ATP-binding protein